MFNEQVDNLFFEDFSERIITYTLLLRLTRALSAICIDATSHQAFFTNARRVGITRRTLINIKASVKKTKTKLNEVKIYNLQYFSF